VTAAGGVLGLYNRKTGEMSKAGVYPIELDVSKPWELRAERARPVDGVWTFYDVRVFKQTADTNAPPVPTLQTNVLAVPEFSETLEEINSEIKIRTACRCARPRRPTCRSRIW
jgi:hypothetical protein